MGLRHTGFRGAVPRALAHCANRIRRKTEKLEETLVILRVGPLGVPVPARKILIGEAMNGSNAGIVAEPRPAQTARKAAPLRMEARLRGGRTALGRNGTPFRYGRLFRGCAALDDPIDDRIVVALLAPDES
jgi:hypothetical protein